VIEDDLPTLKRWAQVAVKVIDDRGNELIVVKNLKEAS